MITKKCYAQISNNETNIVNFSLGSDEDFYKKIGMELMEIDIFENNIAYIHNKYPESAIEEEEKFLNEMKRLEEEEGYIYEPLEIRLQTIPDYVKKEISQQEPLAISNPVASLNSLNDNISTLAVGNEIMPMAALANHITPINQAVYWFIRGKSAT